MLGMTAYASLVGSIALSCGLACGPSSAEPLDCESGEPVALIGLAPGEAKLRAAFSHDGTWFIGEEAEQASIVRTWAFRCGEPPHVVFDGSLGGPLGFGGWWSGAKWHLPFDPTSYVVDPTGARPPEALPGKRVGIVGDAVVYAGSRDGPELAPEPTLAHVTFHEDAPTETVWVDVSVPEEAIPVPGAPLRIVGFDEWVVLSRSETTGIANVRLADAEQDVGVMEVDLATGAGTIIRRGVQARGPSSVVGPRFLFVHPSGTEGIRMESLFDRETGSELAVGRPGELAVKERDATVVVTQHPDETQIIVLPDMREIWLPGRWATEAALLADDGRRVLFGPEGMYVLAPGADTPALLDPAWGHARVVGADVWVEDIGFVPEPDAELPLPRIPYRLLRIPLDGGPHEEILPAPIYGSLPLTEGRWAVIREAEGDDPIEMHGELVVFDPATGDERWIASDVSIWFANLNERIRDPWLEPRLAIEDPSDDFLFPRWHAADDDDNGIFHVAP